MFNHTPVALMIPTRERSNRFIQAYETICRMNGKVEHTKVIGCIEEDDPDYIEYMAIKAYEEVPLHWLIVPPKSNTVFKYNILAKESNADVMVYLSDNSRARTLGFDWQLMEWYKSLPEHKIGVTGVENLLPNRPHLDHLVITKEYAACVKNVVYPYFIHMYADRWIEIVAQEAGCLTPKLPTVFETMHAKVSKSPIDETYRRVRTNQIIQFGHQLWERTKANRTADAKLIKEKMKREE